MAFQSDTPFAGFLRATAQLATVAESAPAVNFLLEERLPAQRETRFLAESPGAVPGGWSGDVWRETYGNHYQERVALPQRRAKDVATFAAENADNHLVGQESNQDVVRLMSVKGLHERYGAEAGFDTPAELAAELGHLIRAREPGQPGITDDQHARLATWLGGLNDRLDARPVFAAPVDEVANLLTAPDWATQLRNVLGLSHFAGSPAKPLPVVLCRYNLSRVESYAKKLRVAAWAAIPTVLEAGGASGPGAAFFPLPKAATNINSFGFGVTVSLADADGLDFKSELLHFRLDYALDDFVMVGEISDGISDSQLAACRKRHFEFLEQELQYRSDVP